MHSPCFAQFYDGLAEAHDFQLTKGAQVQWLVLKLLEALPMQSLFSLLGQGYKVVLCGYQLGGSVAHAMASKLLLQVQQEIQTALRMGVNLSALSMTSEKIMSFAFGSPLFASAGLQDALMAHGLHNNLHTIWRESDASPAFFTACGRLAASSLHDEPSASSSSSNLIGCPRLAQHLDSRGLNASLAWSKALQVELGKLPRSSGPRFTMTALPISDNDLKRLRGQSNLTTMPATPSDLFGALCSSVAEAVSSPNTKQSRVNLGSISMAKIAAVRKFGSRLLNERASPVPTVLLERSDRSLKTSGSSKAGSVSSGASSVAIDSIGSRADKPPSSGPWQGVLGELLRQRKAVLADGSPATDAVGRFWVLEEPKPASESSGLHEAMESTCLSAIETCKASAASLAWLSESNGGLFTRCHRALIL